jgi:hypothetical protein
MEKIIYLQKLIFMSDLSNEIKKQMKKYDYSDFAEIRIVNVPKILAQRFEEVRQKKGISKSDFGKMIISDYLEKYYPTTPPKKPLF